MVERLLGIVYALMNKETVTAAELAERFEVSIRTIYRDIEDLSVAGIPVYCKKGRNGGICLTEQFVLNKLLLTKEEQQDILAALVSLRETEPTEETATLKKLGEFFKTKPADWLVIDLSDWSGLRQQLYEDVKTAVLNHRVFCFDYYGTSGEMSRRTVEPLQLLFKEYTWYLRAFCRDRQDFRLFKLFRMKRQEISPETFVPKQEVLEQEKDSPEAAKGKETSEAEQEWQEKNLTRIKVWIDKKEAYRVYDRFDESELTRLPDGNFLVQMAYPLDDWVYGVVLSFGPSARVISPEGIRLEMKKRVEAMCRIYETSETNMPC